MTLSDANKLLAKTYGQHLDIVYVPSIQKTVMFKPLTVGHIKLLTRSNFIDNFQLPIQILKLSLFDKLCTEDLSQYNISSKTITMYDYLAFLIGIKQILDLPLKHKFKCKCSQQKEFEKTLILDDLFDDIISEYKPQHEIFQKVDEKTNIIYKFELTNFTMLDYLYYKHIIQKIKEEDQNSINLLNTDKFLRPLLYIKNIYINDQKIDDWQNLIITQRLKFFNKISPNILIKDKNNETLFSFISNTFAEQKLIRFVNNIEVQCPNCHKIYRGVYDIDNFFMF